MSGRQRRLFLCFLLSAGLGLQAASLSRPKSPDLADSARQRLEKAYLNSPLLFETIGGRGNSDIRFLARGDRYRVGLNSDGVVLTFAQPVLSAEPGDRRAELAELHVRFGGGNSRFGISGEGKAASKIHSFVGSDPAAWRSGLAAFRRVRYEEVYPGIDAVLYGKQGQLEFDFVVAPQADPTRIELDYEPAGNLSIDAEGGLMIGHRGLVIRQLKPFSYQMIGGVQTRIESEYRLLEGGKVVFEIADYDRSLPLIIDPVITFSSFLGGGALDNARAILTDDSGMIYVAGSTLSDDFITQDPLQGQRGGDEDAFVLRIDPSDFSVVFATYLGGSRQDIGTHLALDGFGNIFVGGQTRSWNFPLQRPTQAFLSGAPEIFLSRLAPDGSRLSFSTFIGGWSSDTLAALLVTDDGQMCLVGYTASTNYPLVKPLKESRTGTEDLVLTQIGPAGNMMFSTFLGGSGVDRAYGATIDTGGVIAITGATRSTDFPLVQPLQNQLRGSQDAFVLRIDPNRREVLYSSYLGGSDTDLGRVIAEDSFQHLFVMGETKSDDFPTVNSVQAQRRGKTDLFVTRINPQGQAIIFSTYLGGLEDDFLNHALLDPANRVYLAGHTASEDFPTAEPFQRFRAGGLDGFVSRIDPGRLSLDFSTYLGGSSDDRVFALAVEGQGGLLIAGETYSSDFPATADALQKTKAGVADGFIARLMDVFQLNFAQFGEGAGIFSSQIELVNKSRSKPARVNLTIRDDNGEPLTVDLNGTEIEGELQATIPAGGNLRLETDGLGPLRTGSVQVTSEVPISGFIFFDAGPEGSTGVGSSRSLRSLIAPVRTGAGCNTGLALMGLGTDQTLQLALRDSGGALRSEATLSLGAFAHEALFVDQLDWNSPVDFSSFSGNLTATGEANFAAVAILVEPGKFIVLPVTELEEE